MKVDFPSVGVTARSQGASRNEVESVQIRHIWQSAVWRSVKKLYNLKGFEIVEGNISLKLGCPPFDAINNDIIVVHGRLWRYLQVRTQRVSGVFFECLGLRLVYNCWFFE
jgi:hypothetical protein